VYSIYAEYAGFYLILAGWSKEYLSKIPTHIQPLQEGSPAAFFRFCHTPFFPTFATSKNGSQWQ